MNREAGASSFGNACVPTHIAHYTMLSHKQALYRRYQSRWPIDLFATTKKWPVKMHSTGFSCILTTISMVHKYIYDRNRTADGTRQSISLSLYQMDERAAANKAGIKITLFNLRYARSHSISQ